MIAALLWGAASPVERGQRLRVWAVMMGGSLAAMVYQNIWFYIALDLAVAFLILAPPKTVWQRAIGLCYIIMALMTIGFAIGGVPELQIFSSTAPNPDMLKAMHDYLGWAALGLMFVWGGDGILGSYFPASSSAGDTPRPEPRRVR